MAQKAKPSFSEEPYLYSFASNSTGAATSHLQRKKYLDQILRLVGPKRAFDFWGKDTYLGRINTVGNASIINESYLKPLRHTDSQSPLFVINFVADAWRDFVDKLKELLEKGILDPDGPYANLKAKKAFRSVTSEYHRYMIDIVYPLFTESYLGTFEAENKRIRDVDSFLKIFTNFVNEYTKVSGPITISGFVESAFCSPLNSGLVISTSEDDHNVDFTKSEKYMLDENFDLVSSVATYYGFGIDQNAPWRFVADLSSPAMKEYMMGVEIESFDLGNQNETDDCDNPLVPDDFPVIDPFGYSAIPGLEDIVRHAVGYNEYRESLAGVDDAETIFRTFYSTAHTGIWRTDMDIVKVYFLDFYNSLVNRQPNVSVLIPDETGVCLKSRIELVRRQAMSYDKFKQNGVYGDKWNLKCYYLLRRTERKMNHHSRLIKENLKELMNVYNFVSGNTDRKYILALKYLQQDILEPITASSLTLGTVGDINRR
jgi:hypothetical protein|tara:strand:+ start:2630 stop:4084 length:1455 start_codon:yes stop_codon:yes gene_type:complete